MSVGNEGTRAYSGPVTRTGPRVLLFVQSGDARPKCMRSWLSEPDMSSVAWDNYLTHVGVKGRWWLVECENAEMGRMIIGWCPLDDPRILASGGKEVKP